MSKATAWQSVLMSHVDAWYQLLDQLHRLSASWSKSEPRCAVEDCCMHTITLVTNTDHCYACFRL